MDQAAKVILVTQATADVISFLRSLGLNSLKDPKEYAVFIGELSARFDMPLEETTRMFYATPCEAKAEFDLEVEHMAKTEVELAIMEAALEQSMFELFKSDLDRMLELQLEVLESHRVPVPPELQARVTRYNATIRSLVTQANENLARPAYELYIAKLRYCFARRHIGAETVEKLVELYKVA